MIAVRALCLSALLMLLPACGRVDSGATFFPEGWRQPAPERQQLPDPEPDAVRLVRDNLSIIFTEMSQPTNVRLSKLRRNADGRGWNVCIKATVTTVGKSKLARTYVITFEHGEIGLRRLAVPADGCEAEQYTRL